MIGPGKYDDLCAYVREQAEADGVLVIVVGGKRGAGFSIQAKTVNLIIRLPEVLRDLANQIEADIKEGEP